MLKTIYTGRDNSRYFQNGIIAETDLDNNIKEKPVKSKKTNKKM